MSESTSTPVATAAAVTEAENPSNVGAAETVEVEDVPNDGDSSYDEEVGSYTESLTSSVRNHQFENGRRYHAYKSGSYLAPNDEQENDRLDMHHHLSTLLSSGKLHFSPIGESPQRILDVGTGTGIWAIEIGDEYPSAEVVGVDLSPTQPDFVPANVRFEVDDVNQEWTYSKQFDLIHSRFMAASIVDWEKYAAEAYKFTKPGGWVEFKDWNLNPQTNDSSLPSTNPIAVWHTLLNTGIAKIGREMHPGPHLKGWIEKAGFKNVQQQVINVPIGLWPKDKKYKEIGAWNLLCLQEGLEGIILRVAVDVMGWTVDEVKDLAEKVRRALKDKSVHAFYTYYIVWAQKPEE